MHDRNTIEALAGEVGEKHYHDGEIVFTFTPDELAVFVSRLRRPTVDQAMKLRAAAAWGRYKSESPTNSLDGLLEAVLVAAMGDDDERQSALAACRGSK